MASWLHQWSSFTLLSSTLLLGVCNDAMAQSDTERAGARAAAEAGLSAYNAGRYSESFDLLNRAESLVYALPHLLYMARSSEKLNQLVLAREIYLKITREQLIAGAPRAFIDAQQAAQQELQAIDARLPYLTVNVDGPRNTNVKITMDDKEIPSVLIGVPFPVDPGNHVLVAESTLGQRGEPTRISLAEGKRERVSLKIGAAAPSNAPAAVPPPTTGAAPSSTGLVAAAPASSAAHDSGKSGHSPVLTYGALGLGAVGAIVGTVFVVQRGSKQSDADSAFSSCKTRVCSDSEKSNIGDLDKQAASAGNFALVSYGVGAAALTAGMYLLFSGDSKATAAQRTPLVSPYIGPTQLGATLRF
jgi:hypothetical protein